MTRRSHMALPLLAIGLALAAVESAVAQSPAKSYLYQERQFRNACPPRLKYAAGTCVRHCPAGYQDAGRVCRLRDQNGGGNR